MKGGRNISDHNPMTKKGTLVIAVASEAVGLIKAQNKTHND